MHVRSGYIPTSVLKLVMPRPHCLPSPLIVNLWLTEPVFSLEQMVGWFPALSPIMGGPHGTPGLRKTSGLGTTPTLYGGLFWLDRHDFVLCYRSKYPCCFGPTKFPRISRTTPCRSCLHYLRAHPCDRVPTSRSRISHMGSCAYTRSLQPTI